MSTKVKSQKIAESCDRATIERALRRWCELNGQSLPGKDKPPAPHQWDYETMDRLQKEGNFSDRQMRIIARTKRYQFSAFLFENKSRDDTLSHHLF